MNSSTTSAHDDLFWQNRRSLLEVLDNFLGENKIEQGGRRLTEQRLEVLINELIAQKLKRQKIINFLLFALVFVTLALAIVALSTASKALEIPTLTAAGISAFVFGRSIKLTAKWVGKFEVALELAKNGSAEIAEESLRAIREGEKQEATQST